MKSSKKAARVYNKELYKSKLNELMGQTLVVNSIANNKIVKSKIGELIYANDVCFGIKVYNDVLDYVMSYQYKDLFTNQITVKIAKS